MCYYNGRKVKQIDHTQLSALQLEIAFLNDELAIHKGFDFNPHPAIRAKKDSHETERVMMEWGFLPSYIQNREQAKRFRNGYKDNEGRFHKGYPCLNATSEELLNKVYKHAAKHTRCLIPSNGFYEWMHVQVVGKSGKLLKTPEKFPYLIQMRNQDEFYFAGVYNNWMDKDTNETVATFAIVTTVANGLMKQIHNSKERMPTILPGDLADAWLYKELTDQEILDIANYQVASAELKATALHKNFLKNVDPHAEVVYEECPPLSYA